MEGKQKSPLSGMTPMQTFIFGIVAGVLVLCTIGFFILLGMFFGEEDGNAAAKAYPTANQPTQVAQQPSAPSGKVTVKPVTKDDHVKGNEKADITLVEFSDFECPFCGRFHPTMNQIIENYGDDVKWVYRHLPLRSIHPSAAKLAEASECAADQGKFWEMTDLLFETTGPSASESALRGYASQIGANADKLVDCVNSGKYTAAVQEDEADAQNAGARGTPYTVVIGPDGDTTVVSGAQPYSVVEAAVQKYLK